MTLLGFLDNKEVYTPRGKRVDVPKPPHEFSTRGDYLRVDDRGDGVVASPRQAASPRKHSIDHSAVAYIVAATRTPVPPFSKSPRSLVPPPEPLMSPHRTTLRLGSTRWTCPPLREANSMHFAPSQCATDTFFESPMGAMGESTLRQTLGSPRKRLDGSIASPPQPASSSRHPKQAQSSSALPSPSMTAQINSQRVNSAKSMASIATTDVTLDATVSSAVLAARSPRHYGTKYTRNAEGLLAISHEAAEKELRSLSGLPPYQCTSSYQYRSTMQDRDLSEKQRAFDMSMHSPRATFMGIGQFEMTLPEHRGRSPKGV